MSHQNPTLQRTSLPRSFIDSNKESTTPEPSVSSTTSSNFRKAQVSKTPKSNVIHKCPNHPEEDLQFYCFNNRTLLCGECLVKGGYADFEVTSVRKASEKVKEKLTELAKLATTKLEDFYLIEKEMEGHEAQIEKTISNYKGEIKEKMDTLRKIIDLKEQEAIEKVNRAQQEKLASIKEVLSSFQGLKEEVESVKLMQEHRNEELTDFEICEYYSTREKALKESLREDMTMKIEKAKKLIETQQSQAQICFSKFEDEFKKVQEYIKNFNVDLGVQRKSSPSFTTPREEKESTAAKIERLSKFTSYYAQEESREKKQAQKESVKPQSQSPRQPAGQQTFSFLNMKAARDESPAAKTPMGKQGTPRSTFLSDKREIVLNKEGSQKNLYQKSSIPAMLNSYKEMLSSKGGSVESVTPKTTAREVVSVSAINSYRSEMPSNKGLLDSFFVMGPQKTVKAEKRVMETSIDQISLCRTAPDFQGSLRDQVSSTSKLLSRNEGLGSFDFDNPFSKKGQNDVESLLSNENKLKQKLKKLNSQMFKY